MQKDTQRIRHDVEDAPNLFRLGDLYSILNHLDEEDSGQGYSEVTYDGVFVDYIETYADAGKTILRSKTEVTYTGGVFVSQIIKRYYENAVEVTRLTADITYNANKTVDEVTVTRQRL